MKRFMNWADNSDDETLTKTIIAMAQSLKLDVIAEGVETNDQLSFLQAQHCDKLQGFLFSRPLPVEEFSKLLQERKRFIVPTISYPLATHLSIWVESAVESEGTTFYFTLNSVEPMAKED